MAALLFVYALAPVAPAQRPDLLLQFAVAPRLLQVVLAFVSLVAVGTATGEGAYGCSNHRLYVYEFLFSVANMLLAGLVRSHRQSLNTYIPHAPADAASSIRFTWLDSAVSEA